MAILSCENKEKPPRPVEINEIEIEKPLIKYGFDFNEFSAKELKRRHKIFKENNVIF